jgi:hypothetical protein
MELKIEETERTPYIYFGDGKMKLEGKSIPENPYTFYKKLITWIENNFENMSSPVKCEIRLDYFNTSSSKLLLELFKKMEKLGAVDKPTEINWYFDPEDEDMEQAGHDYASLTGIKMNILETPGD